MPEPASTAPTNSQPGRGQQPHRDADREHGQADDHRRLEADASGDGGCHRREQAEADQRRRADQPGDGGALMREVGADAGQQRGDPDDGRPQVQGGDHDGRPHQHTRAHRAGAPGARRRHPGSLAERAADAAR